MTQAAADTDEMDTPALPFAEVPKPNDFRILRMMRTSKEKNMARFALATIASLRLYHGVGKRTRSDLFAPPQGVKASNAILAEGTVKGWQQGFLNRMLEAGWLSVDDDAVYTVYADARPDLAIVAASFLGNRERMKELLWPTDYTRAPDDVPDENQPTEQAGESQVLHDLTTALSTLVDNMRATTGGISALTIQLEHATSSQAASLSATEKRIARLCEMEQRLSTQFNEMQRGVTEIRSAAESFNQAAAKYDALISVLEDEKRRQLVVVAEKVQELSGRKRSVMNQLEAVTNKEAEVLTALTGILGSGS